MKSLLPIFRVPARHFILTHRIPTRCALAGVRGW